MRRERDEEREMRRVRRQRAEKGQGRRGPCLNKRPAIGPKRTNCADNMQKRAKRLKIY